MSDGSPGHHLKQFGMCKNSFVISPDDRISAACCNTMRHGYDNAKINLTRTAAKISCGMFSKNKIYARFDFVTSHFLSKKWLIFSVGLTFWSMVIVEIEIMNGIKNDDMTACQTTTKKLININQGP